MIPGKLSNVVKLPSSPLRVCIGLVQGVDHFLLPVLRYAGLVGGVERVGVELQQNRGDNDGAQAGIRYFKWLVKCKKHCRHFISIS